MNWRIIVLLGIIFILMALFTTLKTPEVGAFLWQVYDVISNSPGNVTFFFTSVNYDNLTLSVQGSEIKITPVNVSLEIAGGTLSTTESVVVSGFRGTIDIRGNLAVFEGTLKHLKLGSSSFSGEHAIKGTVVFDEITIDNATVPEFSSESATGRLSAKTTEIKLNREKIIIYSPAGSFSFSDSITIAGKAKRIKIPDSGIVVD